MVAEPTVIYDGECGICRRSVAALRRWDRARRLVYVPFQDRERVVRFGIALPAQVTGVTRKDVLGYAQRAERAEGVVNDIDRDAEPRARGQRSEEPCIEHAARLVRQRQQAEDR